MKKIYKIITARLSLFFKKKETCTKLQWNSDMVSDTIQRNAEALEKNVSMRSSFTKILEKNPENCIRIELENETIIDNWELVPCEDARVMGACEDKEQQRINFTVFAWTKSRQFQRKNKKEK